MFGLAWDAEELGSLNESGRQIINSLEDKLLDFNYDKTILHSN